ncbi:MAG: hypothetical protein ACRDUY_00240 [Nitriliruptorales bacterium]
MRRYLIVANQTLAGDHLLERVRDLAAGGDCAFHVLVPATRPKDHLTATEGEGMAIARGRLERALERFRGLGIEVTGEVGDPRPLDAIRDAFLEEEYDGIVLSTLPPGMSAWLGMDLPNRVRRTFAVPVTHIAAESGMPVSPT